MNLHWLPVRARIDYKIAMMVHKCLNDKAPDSLKDLLTVNQPMRMGLHSSQSSNILVIPCTKCKTFEDRAFSIYGPRTWNLLPEILRTECNTETFKCKLKHIYSKNPIISYKFLYKIFILSFILFYNVYPISYYHVFHICLVKCT